MNRVSPFMTDMGNCPEIALKSAEWKVFEQAEKQFHRRGFALREKLITNNTGQSFRGRIGALSLFSGSSTVNASIKAVFALFFAIYCTHAPLHAAD
jgi:hypothetical protein